MKNITILLLLLSQLSFFAQDYTFGKVSKAELEERFYPLDSTADAAYLYKYRRTYFVFDQNVGGFNIVTEIHNRVKIYTKKGFERATQEIYFYKSDSNKSEKITSIKGYTFNLENNDAVKHKLSEKDIFIEKKNKYWSIKKITMPNIKIGSIIDIKYKIISPYYDKIDDVEFQFAIPVKKVNYSIEIPEYYKFNRFSKGYFLVSPIIERKNGSISITTKERTGWTVVKTNVSRRRIDYSINVFKFKTANIPALKEDEQFVNNIDNYRGSVKFELTQTNFLSIGGGIKNYSNSWETVSKQIYKEASFGAELNKHNYYKNDLQTILATAKTVSEKVIGIFQFVKNQVKWNGLYGKYSDKGVRKAYSEREGNSADINLMLTSMLRSAGLEANPILVSTRSNGVPLLPTIKGFNYVISMVEFPDGSYMLLDATEKYSIPNTLPTRALNFNGRKITKDGNSSWVKLTSTKHALETNNIMVKITEDMLTEGLIRTQYSNLNAFSYRKNNNHIKEEDLITKLEEKNNIEIESYKVGNEEKVGKPIIRTVKFSSEDLIEEINGKIYIEPLLFLSQHTNPFKLEDRKFPVDFATPWKDFHRVLIQIPEGYTIEKLPENMAIGLPENLGVFKYQVKKEANKISTISTLQFNKAIIVPKYYAALKEFYGQMVKKQSEKIVLIKE